MAPTSPNQSERRKLSLDQSESRISPMWLFDVTFAPKTHVTHGIKNTRTQELNLHCSHSFMERRAWWLNACAVGPKAFALRSHVNGIVGTCADRQTTPQVPRIPVSLFPRRPTAHAQTMKSSPRPLASQSQEKHTLWRSTSTFFNQHIARRAWLKVGRVWRPSDVTPIFCINTQNEYKVFASWRKESWAGDEAMQYNGWTLSWTMVWSNENGNWQKCLKRIRRRVVRSKKQTEWETVDHWHAQDGGLLSNDWLENKKDLITNGTCVTP